MTVLRDYAASVIQPALGQSAALYDEVASPDGTLRNAWKRLAAEAVDLTLPELTRVGDEIARLLADEGAVYTPPCGEQRSWRLDPVPLVIAAEEWATLEKGLAQRAELLNAISLDLYGPQELLSSGTLPPSIVFGHSGFLRVVARASADHRRQLVVTGTDLGRTPTGEWQVIADRTQAPSGIGFAMENRRVLSRVLPVAYREAGLHRLAPFFQALRVSLTQSAPQGRENPRIVVLSPGPTSETAYDQAFIATALGFPLVEGSDLVARDGAVWMRVLGRLERVDVVLRRVDAEWSDPLELRGESQLGVTGLTEAVRRGTVTVVNGLGSGVLENAALLPFMSAMCEQLLDEPLRLAGVPTVWAGTPEGRDQLLDRLDELVVRRIDPPFEVGGTSRADLVAAITAEPHRYVGQEVAAVSVSPTLDRGRLQPHAVTLRAFTLRHGSSYRPMIGGLATVAPVGTSPEEISTSKDVWVLKESPDEPDQGLLDTAPVAHARAPLTPVPRVLDDLFWLGRYAERVEDLLRLAIVTHELAEDFQGRPRSSGGQTLTVVARLLRSLSPSSHDPADFEGDLRSVLLDARRSGSVAQTVARLKEIAQSVRDQVSPDLFRVFGAMDRARGALAANPHGWQIGESAGRMLTDILALHGVTGNMVRDEGWHLMEIGRGIERSLQLCHLIGPTLSVRRGIDVDRNVHNAVLQAAESAITHRRRHRGVVRGASVLDLLLLDESNPRSLLFNLRAIDASLATLPGSSGSTRPERLVDDLLEELDRLDVAALMAIDGENRPNFVRFAQATAQQLMRLSDAVAEVHFATGPTPRSLAFATVGSGA
ncbi:circularly permuted type 2 ATP-grasp protein [Aeromicrobium sp. Marseille-Q0843]|uniref:Circularly permuted type 2 ATP-grasp protein n=1 Tax=Aeromicrobium phoceense TaxID=2754045 RepID=A0A838XAY1_9ACTN|nr:circularly permuted type 2 ATP-grasp protein [Aeromicrobium phoceense]MBA4608639.1 circularly permuted type 2 ATP-grasp protein [Aeromicrobium phoceense]